MLLLRLTSAGQLDNSFTGDGYTIAEERGEASGVAVLTNGQIIAVGFNGFIGSQRTVAFFDANGTLTNYDAGGSGSRNNAVIAYGNNSYAYVGADDGIGNRSALYAINEIGPYRSAGGSLPAPGVIRRFALQPDGKAIIGGADRGGFYLARVNPDGGLDTSFGKQGQISAFLPTEPDPYNNPSRLPQVVDVADALVLPDGKILALGSASTQYFEFPTGLVLARFNADGTLDTTFGDAGFRIHETPGSDGSWGSFLRLTASGEILAAGTHDEATSLVARYTAEGDIDSSFGGGDGLFTGGPGVLTLFDLAPDGKIVYGGVTTGDEGFYLGRLHTDGTPDLTFAGDGQIVQDGYGVRDLGPNVFAGPVADIAIAPDSSIVLLAGFNSSEVALVRITAGGALDTSFSGDGFTSAHSTGALAQQQVDVQADGKILVAGKVTPGIGGSDLFLARFTTAGAPDTSFGGGDGLVIADIVAKGEGVIDLQIINGKTIVFADADVPVPAYAVVARLFAALRYDLSGAPAGGGASAALSGRTLIVTGTNKNDSISLSNPTANGEVIATANGNVVGLFNTAQFDNVILRGLNGNDTINGSSLPERIEGGNGNDSLLGDGGNDTVDGEAGGDVIKGGDGNDSLEGGNGPDHLDGDNGDDTIHGNNGKDRLFGGSGDDRLFGGRGADLLCDQNHWDFLDGGAAFDRRLNDAQDTLTNIEQVLMWRAESARGLRR